MSGKNGKNDKKPRKPSPSEKLDALRLALSRKDKPSNKFMRAFEGLMRKDGAEEK